MLDKVAPGQTGSDREGGARTNSMPSGSAFPSGLALSTANLYSAVQPGGSLFGLQHSSPVDTEVAYGNSPPSGDNTGPVSPDTFGTAQDPMVGLRVGGVNVFGGGLGAYVGGVRVGGSASAATRHAPITWSLGGCATCLVLDKLGTVGEVSGDAAHPDNIIFDTTPNPYGGTGISASGFGHPTCLNNPSKAAVSGLPAVQ
jgi:hypothetical protein